MFGRRMVALTALVAALTLSSCAPETGMEPSPSPVGASPTPTLGDSASATPPDGSNETPAPSSPAITIEHPAAREVVSVPFTANGTADTFEATLTIDIVVAEGLAMCVRHLTATSCSGTRGSWEGVLAFPPEDDPLQATMRAYTFSAKDGSMVDLVQFPITIAPDRPDIIMTSPRCGDVYDAGGLILLTGTAALFEAALTIELRDASRTILTLPVTADQCCVESQFSSSLTLPGDLSSGFYDVVAYSLNAASGAVENEFIVQIEVRG